MLESLRAALYPPLGFFQTLEALSRQVFENAVEMEKAPAGHTRPAKASCLSASNRTIETQLLKFMEITSCFIGIRTLV